MLLGAGFSYKAMGLNASSSTIGTSSTSKNNANSSTHQDSKLNVATEESKNNTPSSVPGQPANSYTQPRTSPSPVSPPPITQKTSPPPAPPPQPTSDIAPESSCPGQGSVSAAQTVLVCMTSFARNAHGISGVSGNSKLMSAAASKAQDIINCGFSHTACGWPFDHWFGVYGYSCGNRAENIAEGQTTPLEVFTAWMNSAGHRANILNPAYKDEGIAAANSSNGIVWVMELGGC